MRKIMILIMSLMLVLSSATASFCDFEVSTENMIKIKMSPFYESVGSDNYVTYEFKIEGIPNESKQVSNSMQALFFYDVDTMDFEEFKQVDCGKNAFNVNEGSIKLSAYRDDNKGYKEGQVLFSIKMKIKDKDHVKSGNFNFWELKFYNDLDNGKLIDSIIYNSNIEAKVLDTKDSYFVVGNIDSPVKGIDENVEVYIGSKLIYSNPITSNQDMISLDGADIISSMSDFFVLNESKKATWINELPIVTIKVGSMIYKKQISIKDFSADLNSKYMISLDNFKLVQGNVNRDMNIDIKDAKLLSDKVGDNTSDKNLDTNSDGKIDIRDLFYVSKSFGY